MEKEEIMNRLLGMIPLDGTKEIIELWSAVARISYILNEILSVYPLNVEDGDKFAADIEKYSAHFIKTRFPHHIKDPKDWNENEL